MRQWRAPVGGLAALAGKVVVTLTGIIVFGALMAGCGDGEATQATGSASEPTTQSTNAPAPSESCAAPQNVERVSDLRRSSDMDCATAAEVAEAFDAAVMGAGEFPDAEPVPAAGFSCRASQEGAESEETSGVACTGPGGTVTFVWGV